MGRFLTGSGIGILQRRAIKTPHNDPLQGRMTDTIQLIITVQGCIGSLWVARGLVWR